MMYFCTLRLQGWFDLGDMRRSIASRKSYAPEEEGRGRVRNSKEFFMMFLGSKRFGLGSDIPLSMVLAWVLNWFEALRSTSYNINDDLT